MTTILITGTNRGIGLELVRLYVHDAARVIACCRMPDEAHELNALVEDHEHLEVHVHDVASTQGVEDLKNAIDDAPIDILINNAGVMGGRHQGLQDIDYDAWRACFEVNTLGPFRMIAAFMDNVARSEQRKIVTVSSFMGSIGRKGKGAYIYRSSKAAVNMIATLAATELADRKIISVPIHPGWVRTDMGGSAADLAPEESAAQIKALISGLTLEQSGRFWNYDGKELPW